MPEIPVEDLIKSVDREIAMRRRVYPRWVENRRMTEAQSKHEIACMERVKTILEREAKKERLL